MPISDLSRLSLTYYTLQARRVEISRRRIQNIDVVIADGRVIPDPADLPIGQGRRLRAAIMFLDISGFTSRASETADEQEIQVRVLNLFFSEITRIVEDYGGTVEKNTGDGIMAYFAQAADLGDVRHRAVACALTMFHAADTLINPIIDRSGLEPLRFRICIDHGWITVARLGAPQRFNHIVAVGTAANRTSKMLGHAAAGDLLVGDTVLEGLPAEWVRGHVNAASFETGWYYQDGRPYGFWLFDGRWRTPAKH